MSGYPNVSAADYLNIAVRNASNPAVSEKRAIERRTKERRKPISVSHERLENAVDAALGDFVPAHEVYNDMRMSALAAVIDKQLYKADPVKDHAELELVAQTIQARKPCFRNPGNEQTVTPALIAGLYRQIRDVPASALTGHRWEETKIDGNTAGSVREHKSLAMRNANHIINAIMPASPYYNDLRQEFFELVRTKGATVKNWIEEERMLSNEKLKPNAPSFTSNKFFYHNKNAIEDLDKLLLPHKKKFETEIPLSKPISPESLVRIGKLVVAHHRTWVPRPTSEDGQPHTKVRRLNLHKTAHSVPDKVPPEIAEASRHFQPDIAADRPKSIGFSKRFVEQMDSILPPTPSNFSKRAQLGRRIFAAREKIISSNSAEQAYRAVLGNPDSKKNEATSQHQQTIRDMAETCERFVAAYEGRSPEFGLDADSTGPAAPDKRPSKQRMTANLNALRKAGSDKQQLPIKTFFTSAKRSHLEMESEVDEPATKSPGQLQAQPPGNPGLKRPTLLDPRARNERNLSR